jgi:hypothetical protein
MSGRLWAAGLLATWSRARATRWGSGTALGTVLLMGLLLRVRASRPPGWPIGWVWPSDWHWVALHLVADLVTVILPAGSVLLVIGLAHDLTRRQRALFAAYPVSTWQIVAAQWAVVAGLDAALLMVVGLVPWIAGWAMAPWMLMAMVWPSMVALGGLAALAAEALRSPWPGLIAAWAWAGASVAAMGYAVAPLPLQVLFYADAYAPTAETWANSAVTLGVALVLWGGAGWLMGRARARGWDAA